MPIKSNIARSLPPGASFELMSNSGFKGRTFTSKFYLYSPSPPVLPNFNSVIFVYPDKPYAGKAQAWKALVNPGLLDLAEKETVYIVMPLPVNGESWSEDDLKTFLDAQYYLAGGDSIVPLRPAWPKAEYDKLAQNNLQYVIAEGDGATFVNNFISQHAGRVSGILTFGGKIDPSIKVGIAAPAYLVNAAKAAIAFHKMVNGTDTEGKTGVFVNSGYPLKKVITAKGGNTFDAGIIADAWTQIFSRTAKICISESLMFSPKNSSEWTLIERYSFKELDITRVDHKDEKLPGVPKASWFDYIPNRVLANPQQKVPLVFTMHGGGEDPENAGWTAEAAKKGFIVISPHHLGPTEASENMVLNILEYAKKTYPVDEKRVYVSGFSIGGSTTALFGLKHPDKFAAIAVMGSSGWPNDVKAGNLSKGGITMPFTMIIGTNDPQFVTDEKGNMCLPVIAQLGNYPESQLLKGAMLPLGGRDGLRQLLNLNNIDPGKPDYARYPYWGYPMEDAEIITDKELRFHASYMKKDGKVFARFILFENAHHSNPPYLATLGWDFMSRFSR